LFAKHHFYNYPEQTDIESCFNVKLWNLFLQRPGKKDGYYFVALSNYAKTLAENLWRQYVNTPTLFSTETGEFTNRSYSEGIVSNDSISEIKSKAVESVLSHIDEKIFIEKLEKALPEKTQTLLVNYLNFTLKRTTHKNKNPKSRMMFICRQVRKKFGYTVKEFVTMNREIKKIVNQIEEGARLCSQRPGEASQLIAREI